MIIEQQIVAMRGRDKTNPSHRGRANENYEQRLEIREDDTTSIPSVLEDWTWDIDGEIYLIRIRKLTPLECWRLMGCSDEDFRKAEEVNSNTQLYKQAGNSIVVDVLEALFKQFF